jgi:hypothetical protein
MKDDLKIIRNNDANQTPNSANYKIERAEVYNNNTVVQVRYPDCPDFNGKKILVFRGYQMVVLMNTNRLDPQFSLTSNLIAQFLPTDDGWAMAVSFALAYSPTPKPRRNRF